MSVYVWVLCMCYVCVFCIEYYSDLVSDVSQPDNLYQQGNTSDNCRVHAFDPKAQAVRQVR